MDIHLSNALSAVKMALGETAQKSTHRRLTMIKESPCKINCTGCCARPIIISIAEAVIIYEHLVKEGTWLETRERAKNQFKLSQEAAPLAWFKMNIKCPVLNDKGECGAYKVRPAACSTHFVTSDPDGCDPWSIKKIEYEPASMHDLYREFQEKLEKGVASYGIMSFMTRVPAALLIAERIQVKTSLSVQEVIALLHNEFR